MKILRLGSSNVWLASGVVRRPPKQKDFQILRRWIVERTFSWLGRYRCLARDYEHQTSSSESMVYIASIHRPLRPLSCKT
ncbi:MAG: transposase [Anaerolineales bacterium]|nr:transposase [Anaerolineales bacterium]